MANYGDVFSGLGCIPGEYYIEIDKSVKPVQHQPRRVAVSLKSELRKKIAELEQRQVMAKVTRSTDWISSMIAVRKPTGKLKRPYTVKFGVEFQQGNTGHGRTVQPV